MGAKKKMEKKRARERTRSLNGRKHYNSQVETNEIL